MKLMHAFVAVAATVTALPSRANTVWGAGNTSCGQYLSSLDHHDQRFLAIIDSWTLGYLSGVNLVREAEKMSQLPATDAATIRAFTTKHCRDNPLNEVSNAASTLVVQLIQKV